MKSFAYALLMASASAQEGVMCVIPDGDANWTSIENENTLADADACKTWGDTNLASDEGTS